MITAEPVARVLDQLGLPEGELTWARIGEGQANLTYEVRRGSARVVLRRGPRPPLPPSAHDMVREARFLRAVHAAGVPVPRVMHVCEDPEPLGVPFYVMEHLEGAVITGSLPAGFDPSTLAFAAVEALAALHTVPLEGEVAALGRPVGYLERQVRRFTDLWPLNTRRAVPAVEEAAARLAARLPAQTRHGIVHGDYRLGNLMYAAPGRIVAILDWEMAALGDPLADLGYLLATYSEAGTAPTVMDLTPVTAAPGFPSRSDLAARYVALTGASLDGLAWYEALALWKSAIFCEATYTRWLDGQRPDDAFAPRLAEGVPALAEAALSLLPEGST